MNSQFKMILLICFYAILTSDDFNSVHFLIYFNPPPPYDFANRNGMLRSFIYRVKVDRFTRHGTRLSSIFVKIL